MQFNTLKSSGLSLTGLIALCGTLQYQNKLNNAMRTIEQFLKLVKKPVISAGFGKDSMATAIIAKAVDHTIPIICANPPNPLSDRQKHLKNAIDYFGNNITQIPYYWDVQSVLDKKSKYPTGLKAKILSKWQMDNNIDGIIFGIRNNESRARKINYAMRGDIYQVSDGTWRCLPIAKFTAEESLATALYFDAPINPVYQKTKLMTSFEQIRDGTWWPHGIADARGFGEWLKLYYPEHYNNYILAIELENGYTNEVCIY